MRRVNVELNLHRHFGSSMVNVIKYFMKLLVVRRPLDIKAR